MSSFAQSRISSAMQRIPMAAFGLVGCLVVTEASRIGSEIDGERESCHLILIVPIFLLHSEEMARVMVGMFTG